MALSALSGDEQGILFVQLCNVLDPGIAVALSSVNNELRAATRVPLQQLKTGHEAAAAQGFARPSLSAKTGDETILRNSLRKPAEIAKIDIITKIRAKTRVSWSELPWSPARAAGGPGRYMCHDVRIWHEPTCQLETIWGGILRAGRGDGLNRGDRRR